MSTQLSGIDDLLESVSKDDLVRIARRALDKLFSLGATDKLGQCVLMPQDESKEVYVISPVRPGYTMDTEEEMIEEAVRRAKAINKRYLSAEEFMALLSE